MRTRQLLRLLAACALCISLDAVSGADARAQSGAVQADFLVVPGRSVGKIDLGMSREEVVALLGRPADAGGEWLRYRSARSGNTIEVLFEGGRAAQINFTSPSFRTREGLGTGTYADDRHRPLFARWKLQWRFMNLKHALRSGGLTFYDLNADSAHPDYPITRIGVVHAGAKPREEALSLEGEPNGGWEPWDDADLP